MSCCGGNTVDEAVQKSRELGRALAEERLQELFKFKVLLLGCGETGKSTIVKQIKRCHGKTESKEDLKRIHVSLHTNVIDCMKVLLFQANLFGYELNAEDAETGDEVMRHKEGQLFQLEMAIRIQNLWESDAIRQTYARNNEYWILDSCKYYFKHVERFTEIGYVPNTEDVVMARVRTTGMLVHNVSEPIPDPEPGDPAHILYRIIDVGGQRSERKKWIHQFEDVKCILFIASLAEYAQVCFEDVKKNRMDESMEILKTYAAKPIFASTPFFVVLNKKDMFSEFLKMVPLSQKFPDYEGKSPVEGIAHIQAEYIRKMPVTKQDLYRDANKPRVFAISGIVVSEVRDMFVQVKAQLVEMNKGKIQEEKRRIAEEERAEQAANKPCVIL
jgi:GTPase SAR1 family protein